ACGSDEGETAATDAVALGSDTTIASSGTEPGPIDNTEPSVTPAPTAGTSQALDCNTPSPVVDQGYEVTDQAVLAADAGGAAGDTLARETDELRPTGECTIVDGVAWWEVT